MLLNLGGRRLYYDLMGAEAGPVVCFTHSLSSDSGICSAHMPLSEESEWVKQTTGPASAPIKS